MKKFCPSCGKKVKKLYDNLCKNCFLQKLSIRHILPKSITVHKCTDCQRYVAGKNLTYDFEEALKKKLKDLLKEEIVEKVDYIAFKNRIELKVFLRKYGLKKIESFVLPFYEKSIVCKFCNMKRTGYHNVVLQIITKTNLNEIEEFVEEQVEIFSRKDNLAFISGKTRIKNGIEFKIGSKSVGMKIARMLKRKYNGELKFSRRLVTRKDGRNLYRLTISLRL